MPHNIRRLGLSILKMLVVPLVFSTLTFAQTAPVRVMPLGDSITGSPGCWRSLLWTNLQNTGFTGVDFVGTLSGQGCGIPYDSDCEGHGGFLATDVANNNLLPGWLAATHPDIVMMHFGTNDVWNGRTPAVILAAFSKLVDQMRASNPSMKILVAKILPVAPASCAECPQRTIDFNAAIPAWAASKSTSASPIVVVDQWTGFNSASDTVDGVHPNSSGNVKIANKWYPALTALIRNQSPNYSLSASPSSLTLNRGSSGTSTVTVTRTGGFSSSVSLSASGLPSGVTATFSPNPASSSNSSVTFTASSTATTGTSTVTITGNGGGITHTSSVSLTVGTGGTTGGIVANGTYRLTPRHSTNMALDVFNHGTTDGTNVIQWTAAGTNNQRWTLTHLGNNIYQIVGVESGKALEVASTSTANGTNVDVRTYAGATNQRWIISATSGGFFRLSPVSSSGSALDVAGVSTTAGANVQLWVWNGGNNQQWSFQP